MQDAPDAFRSLLRSPAFRYPFETNIQRMRTRSPGGLREGLQLHITRPRQSRVARRRAVIGHLELGQIKLARVVHRAAHLSLGQRRR